MVVILTADQLPVKSIQEYADNFLIAFTTEKLSPVLNNTWVPYYELYCQEGSEEEIPDDPKIIIKYNSAVNITDAAEKVAIRLAEIDSSITAYNDQYESNELLQVFVCCPYDWNNQFTNALNAALRENDHDLEVTDLYRYLHVVRVDRIVQSLKQILSTDFIYPEDAMAFGYALHAAISQGSL